MSKNAKRIIRTAVGIVLLFSSMKFFHFVELHPLIKLGVFLTIYVLSGYDVLYKAVRNLIKGRVLDENFLMSIASIGAFVLGWISKSYDYAEGVAVMLFYQVGEIFQGIAVGKSRESISSLMDIRPDKARIIRGGKEIEVYPEEVKVGDKIVIRAGEKIALDGKIISGSTNVDASMITGESLPLYHTVGDNVISGTIVLDGSITVEVEKEFYDSTVSKILDLVENVSGKKAKTENFITAFAKYYTPIIVVCALLIAVVPPLVFGNFIKYIKSGLTFLVVSCPCALVISIPLGFFGGIGGAGSRGVLLKGANYIERILKANIFVFDKTGTLTKGKLKVEGVYPEKDKDEIIRLASICERHSNHPIAKAILNEYKGEKIPEYDVKEIAGQGIVASKEGEEILCGNAKLLKSYKIEFSPSISGLTTVYVAKNGKIVGQITVADEIRDESFVLINALKKQGIKTYMFSGDNYAQVKYVADKLKIDEFRSDLLPQDKTKELQKILDNKKKGDVVAFVGDGINDAPVIMLSDVGISMGGIGSDSAIEASDIVLMRDNPIGILEAKRTAKKTMKIVKENIFISLFIKITALILAVLSIGGMWFAVFADVGVCVLAVLNSTRALK